MQPVYVPTRCDHPACALKTKPFKTAGALESHKKDAHGTVVTSKDKDDLKDNKKDDNEDGGDGGDGERGGIKRAAEGAAEGERVRKRMALEGM